MSLATALTVLFVAFKLLGVITWPWWLVLTPVWGGVALGIVLWVLGASGLGALYVLFGRD